MLLRERLVEAEVAAARAHIREVGGNNHGPEVKKFLHEVGLPQGYAWCDAFESYEEHAAAGRRLPIESASVWDTYTKARELHWLVSRPARGDLVLFDFDGDGRADDHIGIVVKVLKLGGTLKLQTVEGNTSSGKTGSQADGGGVYLRTRVIPRSRVKFVRIPGNATVRPKVTAGKKNPARHPATVSPAGLAFIGRFEGFRRQPYNDAAVPANATIGYGHLLHHGPLTGRDRIKWAAGCSQLVGLRLLRTDAHTAVTAVQQHVKVHLTQPQFDALVSFTFNCGTGALAESQLLKSLNAGHYGRVPGLLMQWTHAGSVVLPGLVARRRAEGELFTHGRYT
jgi:GH24 family phage-related lysozyme (muramidase)